MGWPDDLTQGLTLCKGQGNIKAPVIALMAQGSIYAAFYKGLKPQKQRRKVMGKEVKKDRKVILIEGDELYEGVIYMMLGYDRTTGTVLQTLAGDDYWLDIMDDNYPGIREALEKIVSGELVPICEKIRAVIDEFSGQGGTAQ